MSTKSSESSCPLCKGRSTVAVKSIPTGRIVQYWKSLGYDLRSTFPNYPASLDKRLCLSCDLRFFEPQTVGGPDLYSILGRTSLYYPAAKWEFAEVLKRLARREQGGAILEYGCGRGWFLEQCAHFFDRAVGVDSNDDAVSDGRARGLDLRNIDLRQLDETFDVIVAFQVIEHVPDPGETLRQLVALLRPGGELIVAVPNEDSFLGDIDYSCLNLPPHHASCWSKEALHSVTRLLPVRLQSYICEPLGIDLYLGALHERFDKYVASCSLLMRPWTWAVRRLMTVLALVNLDSVRASSVGHTHVAFFRKTAQ